MNLDQEQRRSRIRLNQPFAKAVEGMRRDALSRSDYDPAQLFAWGQMMAVSVLEMLKAVEARLGRAGQEVCTEAQGEASPEDGKPVGATLQGRLGRES